MEVWQILLRLARGVVRRRKLLAGATLVVGAFLFVPIAYYLSQEPPRFSSSATILLEVTPDKVPVFQEFKPVRPLPVQLAILGSRSLAEEVVNTLPKTSLEDLVESPYFTDWALTLKNALRRLRGLEPEVESPYRRALKELQRGRVSFNSAQGYGIVDITAVASKPQVAVDIVSTYIEVLLARTRTFNIEDARTTREFLEQLHGDVRKDLRANEDSLRQFTASHGWVKVPERSQVTLQRLTTTENALAELRANRKIAQTRLEGLRRKLGSQPPDGSTPRPTDPEIQRLRGQLAQLESGLLELQTRYTDEHPRVALIKDRIAEVRGKLGDQVKEVTLVTPVPGAIPVGERVNFAEQVVALETSLHALAAQEEALDNQAGSLRQSLSGLSQSEREYSQLVREVESSRNLHAMLSEKLTASRIREQGEMKAAKVIDPPSSPVPQTSQKRVRAITMALMLAGLLGGGLPGLVEWAYRNVETEEDVEGATGLAVLGVIPQLHSIRPIFVSAAESNAGSDPDSLLFSEAFRRIRIAMQLAAKAEDLRTVMITSPYPNEGKSTVVVNLGLAFHEVGKRVVLAETDLLRPTLHKTMNVKVEGGLVEALETPRGLDASLTPVGEGMWLAARGGSLKPETRGTLVTERLSQLVAEMAQKADFVICDSSPVLVVLDNLFLASTVDGVVLVAKAGSTRCRDLVRAKSLLEGSGARVIGVVINQMPAGALRRAYHRYYSYYYGEPASKKSGRARRRKKGAA